MDVCLSVLYSGEREKCRCNTENSRSLNGDQSSSSSWAVDYFNTIPIHSPCVAIVQQRNSENRVHSESYRRQFSEGFSFDSGIWRESEQTGGVGSGCGNDDAVLSDR